MSDELTNLKERAERLGEIARRRSLTDSERGQLYEVMCGLGRGSRFAPVLETQGSRESDPIRMMLDGPWWERTAAAGGYAPPDPAERLARRAIAESRREKKQTAKRRSVATDSSPKVAIMMPGGEDAASWYTWLGQLPVSIDVNGAARGGWFEVLRGYIGKCTHQRSSIDRPTVVRLLQLMEAA